MSRRDYILKICIVGDYAVGKTSLIKNYIEKKFDAEYKPTLGCDLFKKDIDINFEGKRIHCRLVFWDIAGEERYTHVRSLYYKGCRGALFVYDSTREESYENIPNIWLRDFSSNVREDTSYLLIGNKIDLKDSRTISKDSGEKLAERIGAVEFIETSAKTGEKVENAFKSLVVAILKRLGEI